ncbi:MAG: undecaprenyl-diphosphate phosphatase [Bacteroidetes bacterium]|uniref:Undecaprenyl-diphosphatase n=1 Tax=Candidatus Caccoplasma merdipullorum TaxID=2840718 RepID=A0A9D9H401_9BACT|nr:undecaprenyl-diphosphate phosphatase [Candidatus Caccoplasma merdipullorum]
MSWLDALWLGLLQGFTEYLPVSSSGHLQIAQALMGNVDGEENLTFAVVVHAATVCSTLVVLWREIYVLLRGSLELRWNDETQYMCKIFLSMIPVGIVGLFFKDYVESLFGNGLLVVGILLLVTAVLLTFANFAKPRKGKISFSDAFVIGVAQALAVLPGLSRSGTTIATGLMLGDKKEDVAKFSFLMVIIPILGEAFLDLMRGGLSPEASGISAAALAVGFIAAFISGCVACKWMLSIVKRGKLVYFAYYCVAAGLFAIIYDLI